MHLNLKFCYIILLSAGSSDLHIIVKVFISQHCHCTAYKSTR